MTRNRDGWPGWPGWVTSITVLLTLLHENGFIHNIVWTLNIYRFKQPIGDFFVFIIDDDDRRTGRQRETSDVVVNRKLRTDELLQSQLFFSGKFRQSSEHGPRQPCVESRRVYPLLVKNKQNSVL